MELTKILSQIYSAQNAKNTVQHEIKFHSEYSVEYVKNLTSLKNSSNDEWNEFKDLYSYTAVKHYIIAVCSGMMPVGLHCANDICCKAGVCNEEIEQEIENALNYSVDLGYLEKVIVYNSDSSPISLFKIIRNWR